MKSFLFNRFSKGSSFQSSKGFLIVQILVFSTVAMLIISSVITWTGNSLRDARYVVDREKAFYIAEAGIEYYRWHLAHAQTDFQDGTATSGPYIHPYYDADGKQIGVFELTITPPPVGSTIVTIVSKGVFGSTTISRSIEAKLAIPSLAKYAFVANDVMRFGEGTEVFGALHSNGGIRFDGLAHNVVTSAQSSYDDPDHSGAVEFAVHTHVNAPPGSGTNDTFRAAEAPASAVPSRPDVFEVGRQFPVPAVDFNGFTSDLASLKTKAQAGGRYFPASGYSGYRVVLKTNDTFDLYRVTSLVNPSNSCRSNSQPSPAGNWGTWSINNQTFLANYAFPTNGILFLEDHVWVQGTVDGARLTIASGRFPESASTNTHITVNSDLNYTNFDGSDVVALVAQGDINVGMVSDDVLDIDAALLAKNGRAGRYYYSSSCNPYHNRSTLNLYGMLGSNNRYGFAYTDGTGYDTRSITYDANLLYGPPPDFPLASDEYSTISWREL
mgnify:CR=1 FL=1